MSTQVTKDDLEEYIPTPLEEASSGWVFEAFSESVIKNNPKYTVDQLEDQWQELDDKTTRTEFVSEIFNEVSSDSVKDILSIDQKELWIEYTVQGMEESQTV